MKKTFIVFLILLLMPVLCYAAEDSLNQVVESTDFSEIENFLYSNYPDIDFKKMISDVISGEQAVDIHTLAEYAKEIFLGEAKKTFSVLIKLTSVCILLALLKELSGFGKSVGDSVLFIGNMIVSFILSECFILAIETANKVIYNINSLISMSMPILTVFLAGCGAAKTAACINPVIMIGIEAVSVLTKCFFIPLIFVLGVLSLFSFSTEYFDVNPLLKTVKSVLKWSMGLVFTVFSGVVSIYGSFSASADALSFRAAKYVAGSAVPVVGSVLSDTMGTFFYSCAVVKNAFGTVMICILIIIALVPAIKLFAIIAMLNISAMFAGSISEKKIVLQISEMSGAVSYILGLVCLVAFLFIICIAIIIHTANNIII